MTEKSMNKKQSLYEKIKCIVESGNIAITQNEETKNYCLWSSMCWKNNSRIRCSGSCDSIERCYNQLWKYYTTNWDVLVGEEWWERYIWIYERPLWRPKVGDKVQIMYWVYKWKIWECVYDEDWLYCVVEISHEIGKWIYSPWQVSLPYDCIAPRVSIDE